MTWRHGGRIRMGRPAGFTLLEVMVAVLALGIVVTLLTRAAVDGMRLEGDAHRRLAASRIADQRIADLESALLTGALPALGRDESSEEEFEIVTEVLPLDLAALGLDLEERTRELGPPSGLLGDDSQGSGPPLLEVRIAVTWREGIHTQEVRRTTFGFDAASVAAELPAPNETNDADQDPDQDLDLDADA